ncbi:acyl-CoA dehydrogenase family protein [Nocardioides sp. Bht2]|uniref:acyl-CoA dehydrogenase family protein n=1 Tax=Nocardioides sp. Bht2 TaxID=3392297 RepID=UPI0039B591A1
MSTWSLIESEDGTALADQVRALTGGWQPGELRGEAWRRIGGDLGVAGLLISAADGGAGAGMSEVVASAQALGRGGVVTPFLSSAVTATTILVALGADREEARALLRELADADATACLVVPATTPAGRTPWLAVEKVDDAGLRISGTVFGVLGAEHADLLLVPIQDRAGRTALVAVNRGSGAVVAVETSLDESNPVSVVTLDDASGVMVGLGPEVEVAVQRGLRAATVAIAGELVGAMEWALEASTSHLATRRQFGRQLGSYQSLRHLAARMWIDLQQARAVTLNAASVLDDPTQPEDERDLAASLAAVHVRSLAVECLETTLQVHGGIAFTWEHPLHRYLKRAVSLSVVHGTTDHHRRQVARLVDLPLPVGGAHV